MARIAAIGEVMIELAPHPMIDTDTGRDILSLGYAGDTFNTSIYMARTGVPCDYVTLLGDDPYSKKILDLAESENVSTSMTQTMEGRLPGMYLIRNSENGEREFFYWRKEARARELFAEKEHTELLTKQLMECEYIYFTGITLAIISSHSREVLLSFIKEYRAQGGNVCFDINYRPRLWKSQEIAQQEMLKFMENVDIALLTLDDEEELWGDGSIEATVERYKDFNVKELVLKRGAKEVICIVDGNRVEVPVPRVGGVVDTTGAGDSFNAGYLSARAQGYSYETSARLGIHVASIVIRNRGAIVKKKTFTELYDGIEE